MHANIYLPAKSQLSLARAKRAFWNFWDQHHEKMVKLTCNSLKFLTKNDFRVLTAIEMGMKNHDLGEHFLCFPICFELIPSAVSVD